MSGVSTLTVIVNGYLYARGAVARAKRDEDDLFMLFVFSERMGVLNPANCFTLELQSSLLERFHDWHRRMGLEHSPLDHFRCC